MTAPKVSPLAETLFWPPVWGRRMVGMDTVTLMLAFLGTVQYCSTTLTGSSVTAPSTMR